MSNEFSCVHNEMIFTVAPNDFPRLMEELRSEWMKDYNVVSEDTKKDMVQTLEDINLDLGSYLVRWNLQRPEDVKSLSQDELENEINWNYQLLMCWAGQDRVNSLKKESESICRSNLMALTKSSANGDLNTYWGNDYASKLRWAMRRGGILATTNPQLVNTARKEEPEVWDPIKERLCKEHSGSNPEELGAAMTVEVILKNAWEMRPIYEASGGRFGYISLQVSPKNSYDSEGMITEALKIYDLLSQTMDCTPNVIFKVPATAAGIPVAKELTSKGIGVNITVNFALAQQLAFADVIESGKAKVSFLTEMNGRLDDPVAKELESLGVADAKEVSTWAGVAVTRRAYSMLYSEKGYSRSSLLVASLRGPWHIERSLGDGPVPLYITVFPDKALQYDEEPRSLKPVIDEDIPVDVLRKLKKSKLFMQAYEPDGLKPEEFDSFGPVDKTLKSFNEGYDDFLKYLTS